MAICWFQEEKDDVRERIKRWRDYLQREALVLWFCLRHRHTPQRLKVALFLLGLAYATSSLLTYGYAMGLDFIPDWVPVLGLFDDVLLLPIAIYLVIRWVPLSIRQECRLKAETRQPGNLYRTACRWRLAWGSNRQPKAMPAGSDKARAPHPSQKPDPD